MTLTALPMPLAALELVPLELLASPTGSQILGHWKSNTYQAYIRTLPSFSVIGLLLLLLTLPPGILENTEGVSSKFAFF